MSSAHAFVTPDWRQLVLTTENDRFKARYGRSLAVAACVSVGLWANVFIFTPELRIEPYRLKTVEPPTIIELEPRALPLPLPPKEIRRPVELDVVPDTEVDDDVEIAVSSIDDFPIFDPPRAGRGATPGFRAFDTRPELIRFVPPVYSEFAREAGFSGVVYVDVLVGTDGRVKRRRLQQGVHPLLDQAALEAAQRAEFTPGKQRDIPVEVWVTLPYGFVLN